MTDKYQIWCSWNGLNPLAKSSVQLYEKYKQVIRTQTFVLKIRKKDEEVAGL